MQIKNTHKKGSFYNIISLLTVLILVILLSAWWKYSIDSPPPLDDELSTFLEKEISFLEVLETFGNSHQIFFAVNDDATFKLPKEIREEMGKRDGTVFKNLAFRESYAAVYENGKFAKEEKHNEKTVKLKFHNRTVVSAGNQAGNFTRLQMLGRNFQGKGRGLNLFILDRNTQDIFVYNFDYYSEENPVSSAILYKNIEKDLPKISIIVNEQKFQKIKNKRKEAIQTGVLLTSDEDFIAAKVAFEGEEFKTQIRLKGDWIDHLKGEKWSYRIKIEEEKTILGMRKFSLHHPVTRNYAGEWLYHQILREQDILNLQYHFVEVELMVGGNPPEPLGIYALEESFDKLLAERMQRREGVIIKIDENPTWEERAIYLREGISVGNLGGIDLTDYQDLNIVPFGKNKVMKDANLKGQFEVARALLKDYVMGKKKASEVFDIEKLAKFNAISNLLGADHGLAAHNWRLYYNPITARLEPIGFDGNAGVKHFYQTTFKWSETDEEYLTAYAAALEEVVQDKFFNHILNYPGFELIIKILKSEFSGYHYEEKYLKHNRANIRHRIFPPKSLNIFLEKMEENDLTLSVENYGRFPVELLNLKYKGERILGMPAEKTTLMPGVRRLVKFELDKNFQKLFVSKKKKISQFSLEKDLDKIKVSWKVRGTSPIKKHEILPWKYEEGRRLAPEELHNPPDTVRELPWLEIDKNAKIARMKPGNWTIDKGMYIAPDYVFEIGAGCRLNMLNQNAKIISFGSVRWKGSKTAPIEIYSDSGHGAGIFVLNTKDTSYLENVIFDGLHEPKRSNWTLTGAVNFYNAPVKIQNCVFKNNQSEDGLNIIKTYFEMDSVHFSNTKSDAFDGDFVEGFIKNSTFNNLGNDGIDVSGSDILVENVLIVKAGDKSLSGGEKSKIVANNLLLKDSEIAVASKDFSEIQLTNSLLSNNKLCFTAFQKKPEFGASSIIGRDIEMKENDLEHLIEHQSLLILNGKKVATVDGVIERMYGEEFGKKSR